MKPSLLIQLQCGSRFNPSTQIVLILQVYFKYVGLVWRQIRIDTTYTQVLQKEHRSVNVFVCKLTLLCWLNI